METLADYIRSEVPTGRSGEWVIERVTVPDRAYEPATDRRPDCFKFRPGTYTCLRRGPEQFMTDLYDEWWTQRDALREAARGGEILITGLGLGLIAEAVLRRWSARVSRITILELSADVIRLVAPYLAARYGERIEILAADAFSWVPPAGRRFTVGWHDIWPNPHAAEVDEEMARLRARHADWCDWQGFWPEAYRQEEGNGGR